MSSGITEYIDKNTYMCQLCFEVVEKEELTPVRGDSKYLWEDVCMRCTAMEHLAEMRFWSI